LVGRKLFLHVNWEVWGIRASTRRRDFCMPFERTN
jgi:hypothetical protein